MERLPGRLPGNIKQGFFNSPPLLLIYPQRLWGGGIAEGVAAATLDWFEFFIHFSATYVNNNKIK